MLYVWFFVLSFRDCVRSIPLRVWIGIGILTCIAFSRLYFGEGSSVLIMDRTFMWLFHFMFGVTLFALLRRVPPEMAMSLVLVGITIGSLSILGLYVGKFVVFGPPAGERCWLTVPAFYHVRYSGFLAGASLILLAAACENRHAKMSYRGSLVVVLICLWAFIEYTGSRGALMAVIASFVGIVLFAPLQKTFRLATVVALTGFVGVFCLSWSIPPAECAPFGLLDRVSQSVETGQVTSGRIDMWIGTWELIQKRPLFGYGEVRLSSITDYAGLQPHNFILQVMLHWGIVGGLIVLALLAEVVLRILLLARKAPWQVWPCMLGVLTMLAYSMVDAALYHSYAILMSTVMLAAGAAIVMRPERSEDEAA